MKILRLIWQGIDRARQAIASALMWLFSLGWSLLMKLPWRWTYDHLVRPVLSIVVFKPVKFFFYITGPIWRALGRWLVPLLEKIFPVKRLILVGRPFWTGDKRVVAITHLAIILTLMFANTGAAFVLSIMTKNFNTAVEHKSMLDFAWATAYWIGAMALATPVQVFYVYFRTKLALIWRPWLTSQYFALYFAHQAYLKLLGKTEIDNPDQRMTQDVDSFCNSAVGLFIAIIDAMVNVIMFASVLFFMSGVLTATVVIYAAFGSAMVLWLGRRLPTINFNQVKTEADLRARLQESKQNADSLALYKGEEVAREQAETGLSNVMTTLIELLKVNRNISLFTTMYNQLMPLIPAAIIAYLYIGGKPGLEFGQIGQAGVAFTYVFNGLNFLTAQYGGISNFRAVTNRLGAFWEMLGEIGTDQLPPGQYIEVVERDCIAFEHLNVLNGYLERKPVVSDLTFKVDGPLLITGPNGAGKGQFARALARMWPFGSGKLILPPPDQIMFLSRDPYLPTVTLRKLLVFGCCEQPSDDRLHQVLEMVELRDLVTKAGGFDTVQSWKNVLSVAEQQRLSLARIVLFRPKFAVIDQATSALEHEIEDLLYTVLATIGTLAISTATGAELASKHKWVLELSGEGDGEVKIYPADQYKKPGWKRLIGMR